MSAQFLSVLRQAFKTFDRCNQSAFTANFAQLKQLAEQLTFRDIGIQKELFSDASFAQPDRAPCKFINIFENEIISMSVFVVRGNYTMPLHDHPMMYGILRGIYGKLKVQSYSQNLPGSKTVLYDPTAEVIPAIREEPVIVSNDSDCAILTPKEGNFHEITAIDGVAAFFDILSPPYEAKIPEYGRRRCTFYRANETLLDIEKRLTRLERIPSPLSYYCDTVDTPDAIVKAMLCYSDGAKVTVVSK